MALRHLGNRVQGLQHSRHAEIGILAGQRRDRAIGPIRFAQQHYACLGLLQFSPVTGVTVEGNGTGPGSAQGGSVIDKEIRSRRRIGNPGVRDFRDLTQGQ